MESHGGNIAHLRREYIHQPLNEDQVDRNPIAQFNRWFDEALKCEVPDANALALGTADRQGRPSVRIVLLKGFDERGFVFFTNYHSHKGHDLEENPYAAMTFFWQLLDRQVRIEGRVERVPVSESEKYFHSRPRGSQVSAAASPQSHPIAKEALESRVRTLESEFHGADIPRPEHWGGYVLIPDCIEFWQGRPNRLHDRIMYQREGNTWKICRLAP